MYAVTFCTHFDKIQYVINTNEKQVHLLLQCLQVLTLTCMSWSGLFTQHSQNPDLTFLDTRMCFPLRTAATKLQKFCIIILCYNMPL